MLKSTLRIIFDFSKILLMKLKNKLAGFHLNLSPLRLLSFFNSWSQVLGVLILGFVCLYYPLGGYIVNKIDTSSDFEFKNNPEQSATVEVMSYLIKREVNDNLWTPNLPFIFPSYFLDNMPNFQLGIISALSRTTLAMSRKLDKTVISEKESPLKTAAALLQYPGTIWMFSPQNRLTPAPSANSQYRRARRRLIEYNQSLLDGSRIFYKSPDDLSYLTRSVANTLWKSNVIIESHVREFSSGLFDGKADDVFYYAQGQAYAYHLIMLALSHDYKDIIVNREIYEDWIRAVKYLENASQLDPSFVRNGALDSSFSPNHLAALSYYTSRAAYVIQNLSFKLKNNPSQGK